MNEYWQTTREVEPIKVPTLKEFKENYFRWQQEYEAEFSAWHTFYHNGLPNLLFRWHFRYGDQQGFFGWGKGKWCWPSQWYEKYYEARFPPVTFNREKFVLPSKPKKVKALRFISRLDVMNGKKLPSWGLPFKSMDRDGWYCWWHLGWWKRLLGTL